MSRAARYQRKNKIECGLRVVDGDQEGLSQRWLHGLATLEPGAITLTPYVGGVRFLRKHAVRVPVRRVDRSEQSTVQWRDAFAAKPGMAVIQLDTGSAVVQWVLRPDQLDWATGAVSSG